ncbi:AsmA family protein [Polynucleobacter sp. UB-Siik-W21]|uniref:AsmA family protein n=1 Tax=Polynucleobacter sp. UB-Siik-W21 TaxID=1855646 RepID=UPI001BFDC310|nr:AsmA family protein [Polynucleobacter sp. UB-Siik-W21]QWD71039.1 AsmA family protein [Polynucleobacter sp. UB-Siik-W21]
MNKSLKIFLLFLASIVAIATLGIWYAASSINPAQLTQLLSSSVKDATGRDLKIAGPVSLKLFPSLGIVAQKVSLSNASWANKTDMLTVRHVELDIELLPLLRKEVAFNAINLNGVAAQLQTNKAGDGNWDFSPPVSSGVKVSNATQSPSNSSVAASTSTSDQVDPVRIKNLSITDAHLSYEDFGAEPKSILLPKLSLVGSSNKTEIVGQAQYANYQLLIKGRTSNLHDALDNWDLSPVKLPLDFDLTVNGKTLAINGEIDKKPKSLPNFNINLSSKAFEFAPLAGSAVLAGASGAKSSPSPSSKPRGKFFFSDEALPFDMLPYASGKLAINIQELSIPGHVPLTDLKGIFVFNGSKIDVNDLSFGLGKGTAQVRASLAEFQGPNPLISMKGMAKGFTLEQLMDAVDANTKVKGGDTELAFNLRSTGISMHQLASRANGAVQVSIGKGSLDSRFIDGGGDLLITIVNAVNPIRKQTDQTLLECAVVYLPVGNGQVALNDSIGVVTDRLDMVLSGSVDLKTEALNIKIDPREKSGLTTGVNLAGLVKLQGTLLNPQAGVNKEGVVNSAISIGLGILTGGATILAENAKSIATKNAVQPCKAALHSWSDIYPGAN